MCIIFVCFQARICLIFWNWGLRLTIHLVPGTGTPSMSGETFSGVVSWLLKWIFPQWIFNLAPFWFKVMTKVWPLKYIATFFFSNSQNKTYWHSNYTLVTGSNLVVILLSIIVCMYCEMWNIQAKHSEIAPTVSEMFSTVWSALLLFLKSLQSQKTKACSQQWHMLKPKALTLVFHYLHWC